MCRSRNPFYSIFLLLFNHEMMKVYCFYSIIGQCCFSLSKRPKYVNYAIIFFVLYNFFSFQNNLKIMINPVRWILIFGIALEGENSCLTHCTPLYVGHDHLSFYAFQVYFVALILFLLETPVSKQCRPWSDATLCGIWSGSALFAYEPFTLFQARMG